MPKTPPSSRIALLAPEAVPSSITTHGPEDDVGDRCEEQRHPDAREDESGDHSGIGTRRLATAAIQPRPMACRPDRLPSAVGRRCDRRARRRSARRTSASPSTAAIRKPSLERAVALHDLKELRQQEDRAEHAEEHQQGRDVGQRECSVAEEAQRQHRLARAQLPARRMPRAAARRPRSAAGRLRLVQPASLPRTTPRRSQQAERWPGPGRAGRAWRRARGSRSGGTRPRQQHQPDRHVQPEDPLPGHALDDRAADQRADRDGQAADRPPGAQRQAPPLRVTRPPTAGGERQRNHDCAADALRRSCGDQPARCWAPAPRLPSQP